MDVCLPAQNERHPNSKPKRHEREEPLLSHDETQSLTAVFLSSPCILEWNVGNKNTQAQLEWCRTAKREEGKEGDMLSVSRPREQATAWFPELKHEPVCSHFYCITSCQLAHCLFGRFFLAFFPLYLAGKTF